ncbi:MAG: nucleoside-diphosphate kinase [Patescibacteria group bacterium]
MVIRNTMRFDTIFEKTILIIKPDGVQRGLVGEVVKRLEMKGMKIVGLKLTYLEEKVLREHYAHHVEKPFYPGLEAFMRSSPVVVICAEGKNAVAAVRLISGVTNASAADAGTIRGDLAMGMCNVVHCSDSIESAQAEVKRFFREDEIFDYDKTEYMHVYMEDERR